MSTQSTVSQVVLQARQDALKQDMETQLKLWGEGKITQEQFTARKTGLESAYLSWYRSYQKGGATGKEKTQVRESHASQQAQVTDSVINKLLTDFEEGKITEGQLRIRFLRLQNASRTRVDQIRSGTYDRFHYGSPVSYRSSFSEVGSTDTPIFRDPTEAETDAYGAQEAARLTKEKGYQVSYDPATNLLSWSSQDEEKYYAGRDPLYGDELHKEWERVQYDHALKMQKIGTQAYLNSPDRYFSTTFRYETEEEMDLRGLAEAKIMSEEKGFPVTYDPGTNMFSWMGEPEAPEPIQALDTPLHGSREGSIGYQFKDFVHSTFGPIIGPPLKTLDESLSGLSNLYVDMSAKSSEKSMSLALEGRPWAGFGSYMGGITLSGVGSAIRGASLLVNPVGQIKGFQSMGSMIHPEYRSAFVSQVLSDPLKFSVDLGAGIVGGYAAGKLIGTGLTKLSEYRTQRFLKTYSADDFLPYEQQYKFPEEVTVLEDRWTLFKERGQVIDDFGFPSQHMAKQQPGYRLSIPKKIDVDDFSIQEDFGLSQFSTASESAVKASDRMTNPYLLIEDALKKGYRRTGHDLIPELLPEGVGHVEIWIRPHRYQIPSSRYLPGLTTSSVALSSVSSASNLGLLAALTVVPSMVSSRPISEQKTETIMQQETILDLDSHLQTWIKPVLHIDSVNINLPGLRTDIEAKSIMKEEVKTISIISPIQDLAITPIQESKQINKQIQFQDLTNIQILEQEPIQMQKPIDPILGYDYQPLGMDDPLSLRIRPPPRRRRRKARRPPDILGWEPRKYPVKSAEELLFGPRQRKKKAKPKKKQRKTRKRSEIRLV